MAQKIIPTVIAMAGLFLIGFFLGKSNPDSLNSALNTIRGQQVRQSGFTYINPLLECEIAEELDFAELTPFKKDVEKYVGDQITSGDATHISIYFRDLMNGPWMGINEREEFSPSSLLKVPLIMSFYLQSEKDPSLLERKFLYNGTFDIEDNQNITPEETLAVGNEYFGEELIERTIRFSDNNAAKLLSQSMMSEYFFKPYKDLGLKLPVMSNGEYYIRVKDYASFFRVLYNASYLTKTSSEKALSILARSTFNEGLRGGVPSTIPVASKFGERIWENTNEHQMHDCGIVYYPGHPYLLCVMTKGKSFESLEKTISGVSRLIYEKANEAYSIRD